MSPAILLPGPLQLGLVALIVILLFGASRLGDIGKGLGEGIRNFKRGIRDDDDPPKGKLEDSSEDSTAKDSAES